MNTYIDRKAMEQNENMSIIKIKWKVVIRRFIREVSGPRSAVIRGLDSGHRVSVCTLLYVDFTLEMQKENFF